MTLDAQDIAAIADALIPRLLDALRAEQRPTLPAPPGSYAARVNAALEGHEQKKLKRRQRVEATS